MGRTRDISRLKLAQRDAGIKKAKELVENKVPPSIEFTRASAAEIVKRIGNRDKGWTATAVLEAYMQRALAVQEQVNFMTEPLFESASRDAKALDEEFAATGRLRGPLHGVPISLKDLFHVKGVDSSIGYSTWANNPSSADADIVRLIREAGGIPFVKTNVPQTMLSFECSNPVFGTTINPYPCRATGKRIFTSGGSSGGEAALLACDGSALGFGNDIGGSLRIPAHFCGLYSFKPTSGRVSIVGAADPNPGFDGLVASIGPLGRSVDDLKIACEVLFGKLDSKLPIPYRAGLDTFEGSRKLKFGYFLSDEFIKASPASQRAVVLAVAAVRAAGHECVEFRPPKVLEAMRIFVGLTAADGYRTLTSHLGPDPQNDSLFLVTLGPKLPGFLRWLGAWLAEKTMGDSIFAELFRNSRIRSVRELYNVAIARDLYARRWVEEVWNAYGFDGVIAPGCGAPAIPVGASKTLSPLAASTIVFSVTGIPVGVIPVTRVDPALDQITEEWKSGIVTADGTHPYPSGRRGSKIFEKTLYEGFLGDPKVYDPVAMEGLPVGIQIAGRWGDDEKVIGLMKVVDDALGERGFGPGSSSQWLKV